MCNELESKLTNSLPFFNLPDNLSSYLVFCWFSILITNLHQFEISMEQVLSIISPKWGTFENSFHVKPDISQGFCHSQLHLGQWEQTDTVQRPENNNCFCSVWLFSRLNRKHYPEMKLIWLFKERWPWTAFIYLKDIEILSQKPCFPKSLDLGKKKL